MAGTLTIHSNGSALIDGHSWIEYTPDGKATTTYGTWGNNPNNLGNGLHQNLEMGRSGEAHRTISLNDDQERNLFSKIKEYQDAGDKGWDYLSPCSTFAADSWEAATGEVLAHRSGPISNPAKLKESIVSAEAGNPTSVAAPAPPTQPGRPIDSSVEPCSSSTSVKKGSSGSSLAASGAGSTSNASISSGGSSTQGASRSGSSGPSSAASPPRSSR